MSVDGQTGRGEPRGLPGLAAPLIARAARRANTKHLARLKAILESAAPGT